MTLTWKAGVGALLISVLPTLGLSVLSFHSARQALNEHIYDGLTTMTQEHLSGLEDLLHRAATDIKTWSNLLILQDVLTDDEEGDASEELARLQHRYPHFINLVAVNSAGVIVSTAGGEHIGQDLSSTPAFRMTNQGQTYQSKLKEATLAGKPALIFAEPIFADYDRDSVIGSLIAYLDWGAIDGSLTQTKVLGATQSAQHRLLVTARGQEKPLYDSIVTAGSKNAHLPATAGIERVHIDKRDYLIGTALTQGRGDLINPEWAFHALVSIDAA